MDREDIIRMAREAGLAYGSDEKPLNSVTRFAALVTAHEREAIMKICNRHTEPIAGVIYHAIRARGEN
jgi:hypothetical protein